jgi:hypothetical protein
VGSVRRRASIGPVWPAMSHRRQLVVLLAAALLLLGGAALATRLVIELGAVTMRVTPGPPSALPTDAIGGGDLGTKVSFEEAERLTGLIARFPAALGSPGVVWTEQGQVGFDRLDTAPWIATSWPAGNHLPAIAGTDRGAVFIQFHGEAEVAVKVLYEGASSLRRVRLGALDAYWITGPHEFRIPIDGELRSFRVDGSVLLWQDGEDTFRFETSLPLARAKAIAMSTSPR